MKLEVNQCTPNTHTETHTNPSKRAGERKRLQQITTIISPSQTKKEKKTTGKKIQATKTEVIKMSCCVIKKKLHNKKNINGKSILALQ